MIRNQAYTERRLHNYGVGLKWSASSLAASVSFALAQICYYNNPMLSLLGVIASLLLLVILGRCVWLILTTTQDLKEVEPTDSKAQPNTNEQSLGGDLSQVDLQAQINLRGTVDIKALKPNSAPPPANSQAGNSSNASANTDASTAAESQPDSPNETEPKEDDLK